MKRILLFLFVSSITVFIVDAQDVNQTFKSIISSFPEVDLATVQPDGKAVLAGKFVVAGGTPVSNIIRLNTDGSVDNTFQAARIPNETSESEFSFNAIAIQPDGKILISKSTTPYLIRLQPNGTLDTSYNPNLSSTSVPSKLLIQGDNVIVISTTIFRLTNNGVKDNTFITNVAINYPFDAIVQPDNKVLIANGASNSSVTLIRLNADGSVDSGFTKGIGFQGVGTVTVSKLHVQSDGKIIVSGNFAFFNGTNASNIVRLNTDGSYDSSIAYAMGSSFGNGITESLLQSDGIILAGTNSSATNINLIKLNLNGSLNSSFSCLLTIQTSSSGPLLLMRDLGSNFLAFGIFTGAGTIKKSSAAMISSITGVMSNAYDPLLGGKPSIETMLVQPDGKIVVGGVFTKVGTTVANNLARLNPDGTLDNSFQQNIGTGTNRGVYALEIQTDGKLLIGGYFGGFNGVSLGSIIRLNSDGTVDNGFFTNSPQLYSDGFIRFIKQQASGKILVGGNFSFGTGASQGYNLMRLNTNGTNDPTFNNTVLTTNQFAYTLGTLSTGSLLVAGGSFNYAGFQYKLSTDGIVDNSYKGPNLPRQFMIRLCVLPDDSALSGGAFSGSYAYLESNQLYQTNPTGTEFHSSVGVYAGNILDVTSMADNTILIAGTFPSITNGPSSSAIARVKPDADPTSRQCNLVIDGIVTSLIPADATRKRFYVGGNYVSINQQNFASIALVEFVRPDDPSNFTLTTSITNNTNITTLAWIDNSNDETSFEIERSIGDDQHYSLIGTAPANATTYSDSGGIILGTMYYYRIKAVSSNGKSNPVLASSLALIELNEPSSFSLRISSNDPSIIILTWIDNSHDETSFEIERSVGDNQHFMHLATVAANVTTYSDIGLIPEFYSYRITAISSIGKSNSLQASLPIITGLEKEPRAAIFPNPTKGKFTINFVEQPDENTVVEVFSTAGQKVFSEKVPSFSKSMEIIMPNVSAGLYIIRIQTMGISSLIVKE